MGRQWAGGSVAHPAQRDTAGGPGTQVTAAGPDGRANAPSPARRDPAAVMLGRAMFRYDAEHRDGAGRPR